MCAGHTCANPRGLRYVVSVQVIQYAKHTGIKTINIVRRKEQVQELKDIG